MAATREHSGLRRTLWSGRKVPIRDDRSCSDAILVQERLWCTWYRITVIHAPRKYHKPLTNAVSYGQLLTVENGPYAALIYI
jgi:hypothetical protein